MCTKVAFSFHFRNIDISNITHFSSKINENNTCHELNCTQDRPPRCLPGGLKPAVSLHIEYRTCVFRDQAITQEKQD